MVKTYMKNNWVNIAMLCVMLSYPFIANWAGDKEELTSSRIEAEVTSHRMEQKDIDAAQNIVISIIATKLESIDTHMENQTSLSRQLLEKIHVHIP